MSPEEEIVIIGGGVGGVSLAIRLAELGVPCRIVEQATRWGAFGAGLTLNARTLEALDRLGVAEEVAARGHLHGGRRIFDSAGRLLADVPAYTPRLGDPEGGGGVLRPVLHEILAARLGRLHVPVTLGSKVTALAADGEGADVELADGSRLRARLVVGADGLHSTVRALAFPGAEAPAFTGQGCWRAVFPRPPEVESLWLFMGPGLKVGFNPVSATHMYMFLLESAPGNPWRPEAEWEAELRTRLEACGGFVAERSRDLGSDALINYRPLETVLVSPPWDRGGVVLLGDACHATTPHAGYGAGLAIEDALALADLLAAGGPQAEALAAYGAQRYPRCEAVLRLSLRLGELEQAHAPLPEQVAATRDLAIAVRGDVDASPAVGAAAGAPARPLEASH